MQRTNNYPQVCHQAWLLKVANLLLSPLESPGRELWVGIELVSSDGTLWRVSSRSRLAIGKDSSQLVLAQAVRRMRDSVAIPTPGLLRVPSVSHTWNKFVPPGQLESQRSILVGENETDSKFIIHCTKSVPQRPKTDRSLPRVLLVDGALSFGASLVTTRSPHFSRSSLPVC